MLTYVRLGRVHYTQGESLTGMFVKHGASWEIEACLSGRMAPDFGAPPDTLDMKGHTLWAFPGGHSHGWRSAAPCERVVFHFSQVPDELMRSVPDCGHYCVSLSQIDCDRLRFLANQAMTSHKHPNEFLELQNNVLVGELALMALRAVNPRPLPQRELSLRKTQMALNWYREHLAEAPDQVAVARAVNVCPSYLRRLFHMAQGVSPKQAFMHLRMQVVDELLSDDTLTLEVIAERVGFASASTLRRAIKSHFGASAQQLRKDRQHASHRFEQLRTRPV